MSPTGNRHKSPCPVTRRLHFLIPIRHPAQVRNADAQLRGLTQTLASLAAQTNTETVVRIACNPEQRLPDGATGVTLCHVDLPPNAALEAATSRAETYAAIRADKGRRVAAAIEGVPDDDLVMVVDDDDLVHRRLAEHVLMDTSDDAHVIETGYLWTDGAGRMRQIDAFHTRCGTSLIVPARAFRYIAEGARDERAYDELGSHRIIAPGRTGLIFHPVPFPAAIYRLGHRNASQTDVASSRGMVGRVLAGLKTVREGAMARQKVDATIRTDFFGGGPATAAAQPA